MTNIRPIIFPRPFVATVEQMYVGDKAHDYATLRDLVINDRRLVEQRFAKNINALMDVVEKDLVTVTLSFDFKDSELQFDDKNIGLFVGLCAHAPLELRQAILVAHLQWDDADNEPHTAVFRDVLFRLAEQLVFLRDGRVNNGKGLLYLDVSHNKVYLRVADADALVHEDYPFLIVLDHA